MRPLQPDAKVLAAMNQIEAQRRMRMAAQEKVGEMTPSLAPPHHLRAATKLLTKEHEPLCSIRP